MSAVHSNELAKEKSPYLLQHAHNPVQWRAWTEEAFAEAKRQDKPVFLSIGYSTCHWCHVMERESFENEAIADLLNEHFVAIKVDREERPDIDAVYMEVCQIATGHGGWPLSAFLTPAKEPFFVGTYFPPEDRHGRPGFSTVLQQIAAVWRQDRQRLDRSAAALMEHLREAAESERQQLPDAIFTDACNQYAQNFDKERGGFGSRPKFPSPQNLLFLLRQYKRSSDSSLLHMVESTLRALRYGGIYDHIGFGFHRYSTDADWLLPHFEKMLYDQAMLLMAYTECWLLTKDDLYRQTAEEIVAYVFRDMTDQLGGFYSAEDADSEGQEGKFYVWTFEELEECLPPEDFSLFAALYGIEPDGNFEEEATRQPTGENIPHLACSVADFARKREQEPGTLIQRNEEIRRRLFALREERIHPGKDDKILTDWNGLMIAALAIAGRAFGASHYIEAADKAWRFIQSALRDESGRLLHRYRDGDAAIPAFLDDYAFVAWGAWELYQATGQPRYLRATQSLADEMLLLFGQEERGGFTMSAADNEKLISSSRTAYDGAIPSGNSVAAFLLAKLGKLLSRDQYLEVSLRSIESFAEEIRRYPMGFGMMLMAFDLHRGSTAEIVLAGESGTAQYQDLKTVLDERYLPFAVVVVNDSSEVLEDLVESTAYQTALDGRATIYLCENYSCQAPIQELAALREALSRM